VAPVTGRWREQWHLLAWLLVGVVFAMELRFDPSFNVRLLYVAILLLGLRTPRPSDVFHIALLASGLSLVAYASSPDAWDPSVTMGNRVMEQVVIWITAFGVNLHRRTLRQRDAAERHARESDARLHEQQALARVGKMATIVAHEVRNPLAAIRAAVQVLSRPFDPAGRERAIANEVLARVDSMNATITNLVEFAHAQGSPDEWWDTASSDPPGSGLLR
jgi:signal transduction histidine kinase